MNYSIKELESMLEEAKRAQKQNAIRKIVETIIDEGLTICSVSNALSTFQPRNKQEALALGYTHYGNGKYYYRFVPGAAPLVFGKS